MNSKKASAPLADILVVDDTPDNLRLLSAMLTEHGYKVRKVINGPLAVKVAQVAPPDLILLDINMPMMNGYEVCQKFKANPQTKEVPVIFISALDEAIDKVKAFAVGGVDYITKPFQLEEVLARIEHQLKLYWLQKQLIEQNARLQQEIQERRKAEEEIQLLLTLTQLVSSAPDFSCALGVVLCQLCEAIGFSYGEAWTVSSDRTALECSPTWYMERTGKDAAQITALERFRKHTEGLTFRADEGLLGRVWNRGQPEWIVNASVESSSVFVRANLAKECGLKTALGVPIVTSPISSEEQGTESGQVLAVLVFFLESCQEEERVLKLVTAVANQLGRVMQQKQAEEALQQSEAREREKATQLELALSKLKHTQAQLIQSEKMSSLGQMVAGVAHEINNPTSFIYGNLTPAKEYFHDLVRLLQIYQQTYPNPTPEIRRFAEEIDLEFLLEDWQKLITSMQMGTERIQEIVLSLRSFSRLDESELKPINIHEGIDNTLFILEHRLKSVGVSAAGRDSVLRPKIEVIKDYGSLPFVTCYASQLNQVFMNLLNNAIDALEPLVSWQVGKLENLNLQTCQSELCSASLTNPLTSHQLSNLPTPTIWIHTEIKDSKLVVIRIADNGSGISEEVQQQIFDPFFTTKPVGSGTGLGLSIAYQIVVEKHGGQLSCVSAPAKGAEFIVEIPI